MKERKPNTGKGIKRQLKQKARDPDSSADDESNRRFITTRPAEPVNQVRRPGQLLVTEEFCSQATDRKLEQGGEKDVCSDEGEGSRIEQ